MATRSKRKTSSRRKGASRGQAGGSSAFTWFGAGLLMGLGIAVFLYFKGYLPERPGRSASAETPLPASEAGILDETGDVLGDTPEPRYDFFTVLPEMEVVVPQQELSTQALPEGESPPAGSGEKFILQAGSFRNAGDADQLKARLALLGAVASIQKVTVDNQAWHRVRIGPVEGARQADQLRRQLQDNGIEVLVLKAGG